jgi:hypothetical protein
MPTLHCFPEFTSFSLKKMHQISGVANKTLHREILTVFRQKKAQKLHNTIYIL